MALENDDELAALLGRLRPAGPPPELRNAIASLRPARPAWPWALAAAVLLGAFVGLRVATNQTLRTLDVAVREDTTAAELTELLGGDERARAIADLLLAADRLRASRAAADGDLP